MQKPAPRNLSVHSSRRLGCEQFTISYPCSVPLDRPLAVQICCAWSTRCLSCPFLCLPPPPPPNSPFDKHFALMRMLDLWRVAWRLAITLAWVGLTNQPNANRACGPIADAQFATGSDFQWWEIGFPQSSLYFHLLDLPTRQRSCTDFIVQRWTAP